MPLLLPYKAASNSAKALAQGLGLRRIAVNNKNTDRFPRTVVINWGNSTFPVINQVQYINNPDNIRLASNKLHAFRAMQEAGNVQIPEFTTDKAVAHRWLEEGLHVVERHKLTGHSAEGLRLVTVAGALQDAPLYVKYVKKSEEYRVHVVNGKVVHVQRKARKMDVPDDQVNWQVRNLANGFIYQINFDVRLVHRSVYVQAIRAVDALGLDFGAVDIVFSGNTGAVVLEVNTACGLEGTTLDKYIAAFRNLIRGNDVEDFIFELEDDEPDMEPRAPRQEPQEAPQAPVVPEPIQPQPPAQEIPLRDDTVASLVRAVNEIVGMTDAEMKKDIELLQENVVKLNTRVFNFTRNQMRG